MTATKANTAKRKKPWTSLPCPGCGAKKTMLGISYGYLPGPPDPTKFIAGGCCVEFGRPEICCKKCGWGGSKEDLRIFAALPVVLRQSS